MAGATENKEPVAGCDTEELDKLTAAAALNKLLAAGFAGGELNSDLGLPLGFSEEKTDVLAELRAGAANRELGRELDETLTAGLVLKRENILILCNRILINKFEHCLDTLSTATMAAEGNTVGGTHSRNVEVIYI